MDSLSHFLSGWIALDTTTHGVWQFFAAVGMAYLGGILSSLTPCVYPMIPITVGVIGGLGKNRRSWQELWLRSFVYVSGMAVVYSFLGVLAGLTGKVFGSLTNTSGWYLTLGIIMTIASLLMMEVISLNILVAWEWVKAKMAHSKPPAPHHNPIRKEEITLLSAFLLGASSGFIAAPCTTPVLAAILGIIAKTQSVGLGLGLMLAFSFGMGTLLIGVAIFTGALQILPRSGKWLHQMKIFSGLLLLVFALYLVYQAGKLGGL